MRQSHTLQRWLLRAGIRALHLLPAELAHATTLWALRHGWARLLPRPPWESLRGLSFATTVPGIGDLPHPIGLAAGMDKHAECPAAFAALGCSFVEIGTVTPKPQPGNPKPRMFRQSDQLALINRMGFNSAGAAEVGARLAAAASPTRAWPLGINLGKNKSTPEEHAVGDYVTGLAQLGEHANYVAINISSPNTPGLRALASPDFLAQLAQESPLPSHKLWLKLDPDMPRQDFAELVGAALDLGYGGLILTNTHRVDWPEAGGQSGHPLASSAMARLEWAWAVHQGRLPMMAVGGILTGRDILERVLRGAAAVQIYSALVYRGPWAVFYLLEELAAELRAAGVTDLQDLRSAHY